MTNEDAGWFVVQVMTAELLVTFVATTLPITWAEAEPALALARKAMVVAKIAARNGAVGRTISGRATTFVSIYVD